MLNQSTHSSVAYSTASSDRHGPRRSSLGLFWTPIDIRSSAGWTRLSGTSFLAERMKDGRHSARHSASYSISRFNELIANRVANQGSRGGEIELAHDGRAVCFDGLEAYVENAGDLSIPVTFGNELRNAALTVRERRSCPSAPS